MTPTIPSKEPESFAAGESVQWTRTVADYLASDGYVVAWYFRGAGVADVLGEADGSTWTATLSAKATKGLTPGAYRWRMYAELRGGAEVLERHLLDEGRCTVLQDFAAATDGDTLSHAEKTLRMIDAALEGRITADVEAYTIGGRQVTKIPVETLVRLRAQYVAAVRRQRTGKFGQKVGVTFA